MDSYKLFRDAIAAGNPQTDALDKPLGPDPPLDSAIWRFLKRWQGSGRLGADHAVLFRQVIRWGGDGFHVPNIPDAFKQVLANCAVDVSASGIVTAAPFRPGWIMDDVLPPDGVDSAPVYRQDRNRLPGEPFLTTLKRKSGANEFERFDMWKSAAQKEAVWLTLSAKPGSTNLVVLPTGMGKSLCFLLLPVFSNGLTVVVVPTIALAIDQCNHAKVAYYDRPDVNPQYYAANDPDIDPTVVVDLISQGRTRLVFTSPEACVSGRLYWCLDQAAKKGELQNLVIDEAHIATSWGMYFRVDFQLLAGLRQKWKTDSNGRLRTFLYTATLTPSQKSDLKSLFSDDTSVTSEFLFHSLRPEISYFDRRFQDTHQQQLALEDCLWHLPRPAIIYTTEVEAAEQVCERIHQLGFERVACFTGNTRAFDRRKLLNQWRLDELDLMVATSAFGLGVDKPDVRAVIHCCFPEDLNRYYQEVGRGGRDGYSAVSVLIPCEKDIEVATKMMPKLLGLDLAKKRWRSLWETKKEVDSTKYEWKIQLNSKHPRLLGDRTYQENIKWNQRLILQLSRAGRIEITDLTIDSELSQELGEWQEFVTLRLKDGFNPDSGNVGSSLKEVRTREKWESRRGFNALLEHLDCNRCISRVLKALYGEDTLRCCGGCRWCRREDRVPTEPPYFDYAVQRHSQRTRIIENCECPLTGNPRGFIKTLRRFLDAGIRRFACASRFHSELLPLFERALGPQSLFRVDGVAPDTEFGAIHPERMVAFHLDKPTQSLLNIGDAIELTHVLCGRLSFSDIRYLLPDSVTSPEIYAKIDMWT